MQPDLILLGQVTVDHVVPARPGAWREQLGGNVLYAAAGARLWLAPERIGVVTRMGSGCPFDPRVHLERAGIRHLAVAASGREQLVEWLLYEEDGMRRSLPRNRDLRGMRGEGAGADAGYLSHLEAQSPAATDIPAGWLPARSVHVAPQVLARHAETLRALARSRPLRPAATAAPRAVPGRTPASRFDGVSAPLSAPVDPNGPPWPRPPAPATNPDEMSGPAPGAAFLSVDPSPHYSAGLAVEELARALASATAFLPSEREVAHLVGDDGWAGLASRLAEAGFPEVVVKRGAAGAILCERGKRPVRVPARPVAGVRDPTGAGDAFCGAYAACRLEGVPPAQAVRRAAVAASMVIECEGAVAALALSAAAARRYLEAWTGETGC